jgi:hypothetical protein
MNQPMYSGLHVNQPDTSKEFKSEKEYESRRWAGHKNIRWPAVGWNWAIDVDSHDLLWWIATWILFSSLQSAQSKHKLYIQNEQDTSFWGLSWFVQNLGKQCVGKPPCDRFFFSRSQVQCLSEVFRLSDANSRPPYPSPSNLDMMGENWVKRRWENPRNRQ